MFLPCRPCCGGSPVCFSGCPAKTNTLRLTISASDYSWSCPFLIGGVAHTKHLYLPLTALAGTYDLTKSGSIWSYTWSACGYYSAKITVADTSPNCSMALEFYAPYRLDAAPTCLTFDDIYRGYFNTTITDFVNCTSSPTYPADKLAFQTSPTVARTLDDAVAQFVAGTLSTHTSIYSATLSSNRAFCGYQFGTLHAPNGTPSSSGSPTVTVSGITFV